MTTTLTLEDVAMLYDGIDEDLPKELSARLSSWVREDPRFADQVRRLETLARDAGLAADVEHRMTAACGLAHDLERLISGEGWRHPADVLDPEGDLGLDLRGLARLADAAARRPDPPDGIERVRTALAAALREAAAEEALVTAFVDGLSERPERAQALLRRAIRAFQERIEALE